MRVVVGGGCDYYTGSATSSPSFSFAVRELRLAGEGDLLLQLQRLRRKLHADGLFEPQKRLPRPGLPRTIGVVTAEQGKARDDVLAGLERRGWAGRLVWAFAPVQDRHAAPRVAAALRELAAVPEVEVVIVARGGGSLADLFAFCDETLCRTVALLRVPVISSVGHHTDRTLIDEVAAVSCSTPTHAAEAAVPVDCRAARVVLSRQAARLRDLGRRAVLDRARALGSMSRAPAEHIARSRRRLHQLLRELRASARRAAERSQAQSARQLLALERGAARAAGSDRDRRGRELERLSLALAAHDPERTMARGYALVEDHDGAPLGSAAAARSAGSSSCASTTAGFPPGCTPRPPTGERRPRAELRDGRGPGGGDHPPPGLRPGWAARDARAGPRGTRAGRVLRRRARRGQPGPRRAPARGAGRPARGRRAGPMNTFDRLAGLSLEVDGYSLEGLRAEVSSGFERLSTVVHLHGAGAEGIGEDVVYDAEDHVALQQAGAVLDLAGASTLEEFCARIDELDLFPEPPKRGEVSRLYRRWTFHSAALDLALQQAGQPLHEVLGREPEPVRFVVSLRLGEPPSMEPLQSRLANYPELRFKLDATSSWTPELIAAIVATGAVDSVDFKALYKGTVVDQPPDPVLYRRVIEAFPEAWIEDPDVVTEDTARELAAVHDRITWDAPIHSIADIEALPFAPRMVNLKPSRIGGLERLCDTYDYCAERGIGAYGGGQFELGPGRGQAQYLASLFHPDAPNDLAPVGFHESDPAPGLPVSPLPPAPAPVGFRWSAA